MAKDAAKEPPLPPDILALSFEQALAQLDEIVRKLETGKGDLDESINIYSRGTLLKRHCEAKLRAAEDKVQKIVIGPDGAPAGTAAVDID